MRCKICKEYKTVKAQFCENVRFYCTNGHSWTENYIDKGGIHQRPSVYSNNINDILFPDEKVMYKRLLSEIGINTTFFKTATPVEIISYLTNSCDFDKKALLILFKKIDEFNIDT